MNSVVVVVVIVIARNMNLKKKKKSTQGVTGEQLVGIGSLSLFRL